MKIRTKNKKCLNQNIETDENTSNIPNNSKENCNACKPAYLSTEPSPAQPCWFWDGTGGWGGSAGGGRHTIW